jgi:hypothetical protein
MRIALDPWGSNYGSQIAVSHEVDSEDPSVQALEDPVEECPWAPIPPRPATLPPMVAVVINSESFQA